jgi:hypothetical protein
LARLKTLHHGRVFFEKSIGGNLRVLDKHQIPHIPTYFGDKNTGEVNKA